MTEGLSCTDHCLQLLTKATSVGVSSLVKTITFVTRE